VKTKPFQFQWASLTLLALFLFAACGTNSSSKSTKGSNQKVTLGIPVQVATFIPAYLAVTDGDFSRAGVDVTVKVLPSAQLLPALASGTIQFVVTGAPQMDISALKSNVRLVGQYAQYSNVSFIAGPDVTTATDLKGKTISQSAPGSLANVLSLYLLKQHGLSAKDVLFVSLAGGSALVASAWKSGTIDATIQSPPALQRFLAERPGSKIIEDFSSLSFTGAEIAVNNSYLQQHRDTVLSFLKGLNSGVKAWWTNPAAAKAAIVANGGTQATADVAYESTLKVFKKQIDEISLDQERGLFNILSSAYDPAMTPDRANSVLAPGYVNAALNDSP